MAVQTGHRNLTCHFPIGRNFLTNGRRGFYSGTCRCRRRMCDSQGELWACCGDWPFHRVRRYWPRALVGCDVRDRWVNFARRSRSHSSLCATRPIASEPIYYKKRRSGWSSAGDSYLLLVSQASFPVDLLVVVPLVEHGANLSLEVFAAAARLHGPVRQPEVVPHQLELQLLLGLSQDLPLLLRQLPPCAPHAPSRRETNARHEGIINNNTTVFEEGPTQDWRSRRSDRGSLQQFGDGNGLLHVAVDDDNDDGK